MTVTAWLQREIADQRVNVRKIGYVRVSIAAVFLAFYIYLCLDERHQFLKIIWTFGLFFLLLRPNEPDEQREAAFALADDHVDSDRMVADVWVDDAFHLLGVLWIEDGRLNFASSTGCFRWRPEDVRLVGWPNVTATAWSFTSGRSSEHEVLIYSELYCPAGSKLIKRKANQLFGTQLNRMPKGDLNIFAWAAEKPAL